MIVFAVGLLAATTGLFHKDSLPKKATAPKDGLTFYKIRCRETTSGNSSPAVAVPILLLNSSTTMTEPVWVSPAAWAGLSPKRKLKRKR